MRKTLLLISFILLTTIIRAQVFTVDSVYYNGPTSNRINLVIMGDGYTAAETTQFRNDAQSVADYFFNTPPFSFYRNFFNFFAIEVISNESGNDHPGNATDEPGGGQPITSVDNYLETTFDYGGTHRCVFSSQTGQIFSIANTNVPSWDFVNVIINTTYYGGCAGTIAFSTMNSSSSEVFTHEFGHMFAGLSDEYDYGSTCSGGTSQGVNVSQQTDTSLLVWRKWLTTAPIPTPANTSCGLIGMYEGANYCSTNWYRPKCDCKMRTLFEPYCEVCYEQFIYKIASLVNYIDNFSPASTTLSLCQGSTQAFHATVLNTTDSTIRLQWFVDNVLVQSHNPNYTFNSSSFSAGSHQVKVVTYDTTSAVKKQLSQYQQIWTVNVNAIPVATINTTASPTICLPAVAVINAGTGTNYTYQWLKNNIQISGAIDSTFSVNATGNYSVVVSNTSCSATSAVLHFNAFNSPNATFSIAGNDSACAGSVVNLSATVCNSCKYQWKNNNNDIPGATHNNFGVTFTGDYSINIIDTVTGCSSLSSPQTIYIANFNAIAATDQPISFCENDSVLLTALPSGYSYQWCEDNSPLFGDNNDSLTVYLGGDYSVIVSDGLCADTSNSFHVIVNSPPAVSFSGVPDTVCLDNAVYNLFGIPFGGFFMGDGLTGSDFSPFTAGVGPHQITYYYTDIHGCSNSSNRIIFVDICLGLTNSDYTEGFSIYPNPTNSSVVLEYNLPNEKQLTVKIYDAIGNLVSTVVDGKLPAGRNLIPVDLSDSPGGIFVFEINVEGKRLIRKLAVIK